MNSLNRSSCQPRRTDENTKRIRVLMYEDFQYTIIEKLSELFELE